MTDLLEAFRTQTALAPADRCFTTAANVRAHDSLPSRRTNTTSRVEFSGAGRVSDDPDTSTITPRTSSVCRPSSGSRAYSSAVSRRFGGTVEDMLTPLVSPPIMPARLGPRKRHRDTTDYGLRTTDHGQRS